MGQAKFFRRIYASVGDHTSIHHWAPIELIAPWTDPTVNATTLLKFLNKIAEIILNYIKLTAELTSHLIYQAVYRHKGGKMSIYGTKYRKDNQSRSLKHPGRLSKLGMYTLEICLQT